MYIRLYVYPKLLNIKQIFMYESVKYNCSNLKDLFKETSDRSRLKQISISLLSNAVGQKNYIFTSQKTFNNLPLEVKQKSPNKKLGKIWKFQLKNRISKMPNK